MLVRRALAILCLGACSAACAGTGAPGVDGGVAQTDGGTPDRDAQVVPEDAAPDDPVDAGAGDDAGERAGDDAGLDGGTTTRADAGTTVGADAGSVADARYSNFVLHESGDPFCARFGGLYHLYLPDQMHRDGEAIGGRVVAFTSRDLVHWDRAGTVFDNVDESYGGQRTVGLWAPEVLAHGGRYYLYYVNVMSGAHDERVGDKDIVVIESDDPLDFRSGTRRTVLLDDELAFIDPSPFQDPATGRLYLLFKRRGAFGGGSELRIRPMSSPLAFDGSATTLLRSSDVPGSEAILEHPMLRRAGGVYYLLFSKGDGAGTTYTIAYATADRPIGPFSATRVLFESDPPGGEARQRVISPGAASIVRDGAGDTWMVYRQKTTLEHTFADRAVAIDRVELDPAARVVRGTATRNRTRAAPVPLP